MINSEVYKRISKKFEDGIFTSGEKCDLPTYDIKDDIWDIPEDERTPEVCCSIIDYGNFSFEAVPEESLTREFFINGFSNDEVFAYIKANIDKFDREFFKDLIVTNKYATSFSNNCFEIMPVEYIDEEMCSLAILNSTGWSDDDWFYSVLDRKKEALTADIWKMGARFYSRMVRGTNEFLLITPDEYKDEEYYREMCCCNYNVGMELDTNKGRIMSSIPEDVITLEFVVSLLYISMNNIARFNENALETIVSYENADGEKIQEKLWQYVVKLDGNLIRYIPLNDERVEFFLSHYDKDSFEYDFAFKDNYKEYKKKLDEKEGMFEQVEHVESIENAATRVVLDGMLYIKEGADPSLAIDNETNRNSMLENCVLPIKYDGRVPKEFCKDYDKEEYLALACDMLGIKINGKYDYLFYNVTLPEGFTAEGEGYWYQVKDNDGKTVMKYFYDPKFYNREAYVSEINVALSKKDEESSKVFVKTEEN